MENKSICSSSSETSFRSSHEMLPYNKPTFIPSFSTVIITQTVLWLCLFDRLIVSLSVYFPLYILQRSADERLAGLILHMKPFNGIWERCHCHCTPVLTVLINLKHCQSSCEWKLMFVKAACLSDWIRYFFYIARVSQLSDLLSGVKSAVLMLTFRAEK